MPTSALIGRLVVPGLLFAAALGVTAFEAHAAKPSSRPGALGSGFVEYEHGPAGGSVWIGAIAPARREAAIYLPPGYDPAKSYPVVYLLAGMPGSPWSYVHALRLATVADGLISSGQAFPFIGVAPPAGPSEKYNGEWAGPWEDYVVRDVVPWVDAHLATVAGRGGRTLAGLSAGGYGAIDIGLRHPRLFGQLESWSGYFTPLRDGPFAAADRATLAAHNPMLLVQKRAALLRRLGTRFLLSTGPSHGPVHRRGTILFARNLRSLSLPADLELYPVTDHWRREFDAGILWANRR